MPAIDGKVKISSSWKRLKNSILKPGAVIMIAFTGFIFEFLIELPFAAAIYLSRGKRRLPSRKPMSYQP